MKWFGSNTTAALVPMASTIEVPTVEVPIKPVAKEVAVELNEMEQQELNRVMESLGLDNSALSKQQLLCALKHLDIPVFDFEEVRCYMNKLFKSERSAWGWRPIRSVNVDFSGIERGYAGDNWANGKVRFGNSYEQAIPLAVLLTAEKIQRAMPSVGFFVSDAVRKSDVRDPFLAVSLPGLAEMIVVEVWDEPGFKR